MLGLVGQEADFGKVQYTIVLHLFEETLAFMPAIAFTPAGNHELYLYSSTVGLMCVLYCSTEEYLISFDSETVKVALDLFTLMTGQPTIGSFMHAVQVFLHKCGKHQVQ